MTTVKVTIPGGHTWDLMDDDSDDIVIDLMSAIINEGTGDTITLTVDTDLAGVDYILSEGSDNDRMD